MAKISNKSHMTMVVGKDDWYVLFNFKSKKTGEEFTNSLLSISDNKTVPTAPHLATYAYSFLLSVLHYRATCFNSVQEATTAAILMYNEIRKYNKEEDLFMSFRVLRGRQYVGAVKKIFRKKGWVIKRDK